MEPVGLNRLETEQTNKLLYEYAIPAIVGTMVVALYNLIDSIYIGHGPGLGDHAIGGLGIVLPVMTLFSAIGSLVATGAAGRVSIYLGSGEKVKAESVLSNALLLIVLITFIFIFSLYIWMEPILLMIGATTETYPFAREFLLFYLLGSLFVNINYTLCSIIRASGYPNKSMYIMLFGVVANIILAPIFIFLFKWGMKGAAIATSLSAFLSFLPALYHFTNNSVSVGFKKRVKLPDISIIKSILSIGSSPFIMQLAASLVVFFINNRLRVYGDSQAIEAYTIANRITLVIILVISGLTQGMQPIVGYNFGAKKIERVKSTVYGAMKAGICIGLVGLVIGLFFSEKVVILFNPTSGLAGESAYALRILSLFLPLSGLQMVISVFFQSIGMPFKATGLSLTRQFLFLIPALYILPSFWGLNGVWFSIPLSDLLSTILAVILYMWQIRRI